MLQNLGDDISVETLLKFDNFIIFIVDYNIYVTLLILFAFVLVFSLLRIKYRELKYLQLFSIIIFILYGLFFI